MYSRLSIFLSLPLIDVSPSFFHQFDVIRRRMVTLDFVRQKVEDTRND